MKKLRLIFVVLVLAMVIVGLIGCADGSDNEGDMPTTQAKIKIDKNEIVIDIGATETIKAQVLEQGAEVKWESSNPAICTVENGVVKGISSGEAVVTASTGGESAYCVVEVRAPQSTGSGYNITLSKNNLSLKVSESYTVTAIVKDTNGAEVSDAKLTYISSNDKVAAVSSDGTITAVGEGSADIQVKYTKDGDWVSSTVKVTVSSEYIVSITPFSETLNVGSSLDLNYSVTKDGQPYTYPADKIVVSLSNDAVAAYEDGKVKGLSVGNVTLTVLLSDVDVKAVYNFSVLDANAEPINLSIDSNIIVYLGTSVQLKVGGVSWGTLSYELSDDRFYIEDGVLYGPSETAEATLTVKHVETKQTVTATVKCVELNPCITTAEQFLALGSVTSGSAYLGADIDLSEANWKMIEGYAYSKGRYDVAYLVDKLRIPLDGKGYKVTVRYDGKYGDSVQIGGLFLEILATGSVKNLQIDFEATYTCKEVVNTGSDAFKACALAYRNVGTVQDNYIDARFYATTSDKSFRTCVIGYYGGTIKRNILQMSSFKNNTLQSSYNFGWEKSGSGNTADNVIIANFSSSEQNKYVSRSEFYNAWANNEILNQETYTNWSVESNKLYLCGVEAVDNAPVIEEFNPCITTAEQFLKLGEATKDCYLDADIDLSEVNWKMVEGYAHTSALKLDIAYLVEKLSVTLDGKGHKIIVRYDHEFDDGVQIGGVFLNIGSTATVKNLQIDFVAKYTGMSGVSGTGSDSYKVCALAFNNVGLVYDNFIDAKFYADTKSFTQRTCSIGYYGGDTDRNIMITASYKNNVLQTGGTLGWEKRSGGDQTNNVVIANFASPDQNKYLDIGAFFIAWSNNEILNQDTYTAWTVDSDNEIINLANVEIIL